VDLIGLAAEVREVAEFLRVQSAGWAIPSREMLYSYGASNPVANTDPTGEGACNAMCIAAMARLAQKPAAAEKDIQQNLQRFPVPPDSGHLKEKEPRINGVTKELGQVIKYCGCDLAKGLLDRAKKALDELERAIRMLAQELANGQVIRAFQTLALIATLLLLIAALLAAIVAAAAC
jgi:hypothetical protein